MKLTQQFYEDMKATKSEHVPTTAYNGELTTQESTQQNENDASPYGSGQNDSNVEG